MRDSNAPRIASGGDDGPGWMVTFTDLITLLFCFFVLLTVLSNQPKNCSQLVDYMQGHRDDFKDFEVRSNKKECIISLPSDFLFHSGSAKLQSKNIGRLDPLFDEIPNFQEHRDDLILVDGHTDDVAINTRRFKNNWELSSARATNIANYLIKQKNYDQGRISVRSFGESRPRMPYADPVGDRLKGAELRKARRVNRRVEVVLAEKPKDYDLINLLFSGKS